MKISEYLKTAHQTDQLPNATVADAINPYLGLAGEIGYLLTVLKKEVRGKGQTAEATRASVKDELGDIVWYVSAIAKRTGIDFRRDVLFGNLLRVRNNYTDNNLSPAPLLKSVLKPGGDVAHAIEAGPKIINTFGDYQKLAVRTSKFKSRDALVPFLVQIWNNVGVLLAPFGYSKGPIPSKEIPVIERDKIAKALGDIMWYVAGFANIYTDSLDGVMQANAEKIISAFPSSKQKKRTPLYDEGLGALRQFPRKFNVDFVSQDENTAVMIINGVRIGDPLTDNSYEELEGYRYHDAIHLALIAILGWSPVMRGLMKRKRKGLGNVDEVEDGARAQIVEEMIVKISHTHAIGFGKRKLLDEKEHINLNLLKDIVNLAEGLEVAGDREGFEGCKYWEWQEAILLGFKIYNELRRNHGGRVTLDLNKRAISFSKLKNGQGFRMLMAKP